MTGKVTAQAVFNKAFEQGASHAAMHTIKVFWHACAFALTASSL